MPTPNDIEDWTDFLETNNCKGIVEFEDWIMCVCPFHEQTDDSRPSFGINKELGIGNCFGCGRHTWEDICEAFGLSSIDFIDGVRANAWERFRNKIKGKGKRKFKRFALPNQLVNPFGVKASTEYLLKRGIHKETVESFGIRLCIDESSKYMNHLIFPIEDEKGVLYFDARYVGKKKWKPRWRSPKDCAKWKTFYNWHYGESPFYLCFVEGATDVLKMVQFGVKNTIAAKYFSPEQFDLVLKAGPRFIFLAYDEDEAGRYAVSEKTGKPMHFMHKAKTLFSDAGISIQEVQFPEGCKDPGDIESEEALYSINRKLQRIVEES